MHLASAFNQQQRCGVKEQKKGFVWEQVTTNDFTEYQQNSVHISHFFQSATWEQSISWLVWTCQMINVWLQPNITKVEISLNYIKLWVSAALHDPQVLSVNIIRASFNRWKQWNELKNHAADADWWFSTFHIASKKRNVPSGVQIKDTLITSRPVVLMSIYIAPFHGAIQINKYLI